MRRAAGDVYKHHRVTRVQAVEELAVNASKSANDTTWMMMGLKSMSYRGRGPIVLMGVVHPAIFKFLYGLVHFDSNFGENHTADSTTFVIEHAPFSSKNHSSHASVVVATQADSSAPFTSLAAALRVLLLTSPRRGSYTFRASYSKRPHLWALRHAATLVLRIQIRPTTLACMQGVAAFTQSTGRRCATPIKMIMKLQSQRDERFLEKKSCTYPPQHQKPRKTMEMLTDELGLNSTSSSEIIVDAKVMTDPCVPGETGASTMMFSGGFSLCGGNNLGFARRQLTSTTPEQDAHSKCPADSFCCFDESFPRCSIPPFEVDAGDATDRASGWTLLLRQTIPDEGTNGLGGFFEESNFHAGADAQDPIFARLKTMSKATAA